MQFDPTTLAPLERTTVQIAALHFSHVGRTKMVDTLRSLGLRLPSGRALSLPNLKPVFENLIERGLLEQSKEGLRCRRGFVDQLTDDAHADGRLSKLAEVVFAAHSGARDAQHPNSFYRSYDSIIRDLRLALFRHDADDAQTRLDIAFEWFPLEAAQQHPLDAIDGRGVEAPWFTELPAALGQGILLLLARDGISRMVLRPGLTEALANADWQHPEQADEAAYHIADHALMCGKSELVTTLFADTHTIPALTLKGWAALVDGDLDAARAHYELAYQALHQGTRKRNLGLYDLAGLFSLLPLLAADQLDLASQRSARAGKDNDNPLSGFYTMWDQVIAARRGEHSGHPRLGIPNSMVGGPYHFLVLLATHWIAPPLDEDGQRDLEGMIRRADTGGFAWVAGQARALLARARDQEPPTDLRLPLVDLIVPKAAWEFTLDALNSLGSSDDEQQAGATPAATGERLVWWLDLLQNYIEIEPRVQKRTKKGSWTKGRKVALEHLYHGTLDCIDDADRPVCAAISLEHEPWGWGNDSYDFDPARAWPALVGHPLLFRADDPGVTLELVAGAPELHVDHRRDHLLVTLVPELPSGDPPQSVTEESRGRWCLVRFDTEQQRIGELLDGGLVCPLTAEDQLRRTLGHVAPLVDIHSDIGGGQDLPQVDGDARAHLALTPLHDGLAAELMVRPHGADGSGYRPGEGGAELTAATPDGERQRVRRDLAAERHNGDALVDACPILADHELEPGHWQLPEPAASLELLEQLQAIDTEQVIIEWPQGQPLRLAGRSNGSNLSLALRHNGDWFEASGELVVDEQQVLDLQRLLALVGATRGRFLPLGDGRFLALTEGFRRRLDDLRQLADSSAHKPRYHPLTADLLEEIGSELGDFDTDDAWQQRVERLRDLDQTPAAIPSTLGAELRDYQIDGYRWLMRLADWGVGACLADDMGLGKTVQTLALLIARAPQGPSLVLAPTSVAANWLAEARRFAPTLNPVQFGPGDRQAQLDALGPFDLLIASYGLMQQEIDRFVAREDWNCLVLDEAQAIKNPATRRAKAAFRLQAGFRVATTGTPIENHLGELWSLFRFLNPGLLGSHQAFNQRYAGPLERDDDHAARDRLRRLVRPFILRRLKSAVLDELPPRTEIVLQVERSAEEVTFYEALRRQTLAELDRDAEGGDREQQRFQVLAAITRLRRAACNPALVAPEAGIPSAKLALFLDTVDELREGRHKALVFSQFVGHLTLIRAALDERAIGYQYLDGATPADTRAKRVQAFQSGDGDLFLISLKAGGTGLNLTAADYVIHLDPWWNPAVEDQASDRAHRIGQQRPVTVYRLVARDSIEERIIDLHATKRDLADGLLEGGDAAARLDTDEMLALMRGDEPRRLSENGDRSERT